MLHVHDNEGELGTIDLIDGELVADPEHLLELTKTRLRRDLTPEKAYESLNGWSNGWVWITEEIR